MTAEGHTVSDISEAIKRGLLTELDWCSELDKQREVFGMTWAASEGERVERRRESFRKSHERKKELSK